MGKPLPEPDEMHELACALHRLCDLIEGGVAVQTAKLIDKALEADDDFEAAEQEYEKQNTRYSSRQI